MTSASLPTSYAHPDEGSWTRYFGFNTDAKVIGIQYIVVAFFFFLIGGLLAMIIRGELITPASDLVDRTVYNGIYTMHGTIMLFLFVFPVLNGLNNLLIPTMIGAPDMAFPRLNAVAFLVGTDFWHPVDLQLFCARWPGLFRLVVLPTCQHSEPPGPFH